MYCKWELQEDCSDLWQLMLRFDSEADLRSHNLGRSMLEMCRDDDAGLHQMLPLGRSATASDPFEAIRTTLAAVDTAFQAMQPQVHVGVVVHSSWSSPQMLLLPLCNAICLFPLWAAPHHSECKIEFTSNLPFFDSSPFRAHSPCGRPHSICLRECFSSLLSRECVFLANLHACPYVCNSQVGYSVCNGMSPLRSLGVPSPCHTPASMQTSSL
jgi:hypothetical protein